jgi:hypothetical protein
MVGNGFSFTGRKSLGKEGADINLFRETAIVLLR